MAGRDISASYWQQQVADKPLFPEVLWSRPERRNSAGKLLIIGGNGYGFTAPADAYSYSQQSGIGEARVILPDALKSTIGRILQAGQFAASTPSGSFSQKALADILDESRWADAVLVAGDLGRNSETTMLLEKFIGLYRGQLTLTNDAIDDTIRTPSDILNRSDTTLVMGMGQLQKLASSLAFAIPFTFSMDLLRLVEGLHELTLKYPFNIIVSHVGQICVAINGRISTTKVSEENDRWQTKVAADAAVWWLQNPETSFAALTSAMYITRRD